MLILFQFLLMRNSTYQYVEADITNVELRGLKQTFGPRVGIEALRSIIIIRFLNIIWIKLILSQYFQFIRIYQNWLCFISFVKFHSPQLCKNIRKAKNVRFKAKTYVLFLKTYVLLLKTYILKLKTYICRLKTFC